MDLINYSQFKTPQDIPNNALVCVCHANYFYYVGYFIYEDDEHLSLKNSFCFNNKCGSEIWLGYFSTKLGFFPIEDITQHNLTYKIITPSDVELKIYKALKRLFYKRLYVGKFEPLSNGIYFKDFSIKCKINYK